MKKLLKKKYIAKMEKIFIAHFGFGADGWRGALVKVQVKMELIIESAWRTNLAQRLKVNYIYMTCRYMW